MAGEDGGKMCPMRVFRNWTPKLNLAPRHFIFVSAHAFIYHQGKKQVETQTIDWFSLSKFGVPAFRPLAQSNLAARKMVPKPTAEIESEGDDYMDDDDDQEEDGEKKSLYEILGVPSTATQGEIKKAYYSMALKLHPDKNPGNEEAHRNFQTLQRVYAVLGDADKRAIYDKTGSLEDSEELGGEQFEQLYNYYRSMYPEVTVDAIESYENTYRGSELETKELKELYTKHQGNMRMVFQWQICSEESLDSHRFMEAIQAGIAAGELKSYPKFQAWAKKVAATPAPADVLQKPISEHRGGKESSKKEKRGDGGAGDLMAMIKRNNQARAMTIVDALESKYGGSTARKGKGKGKENGHGGEEEPSEEEFRKAQERIMSKKSGGAAKKSPIKVSEKKIAKTKGKKASKA
eukprot:jgi/Mesvir1/28710/Mv19681-RA.1